MARSLNEAILIVLDVGSSVGQQMVTNGRTFMDNAKHCATMILLRKIFSTSKDEVGLILVGSEETNNPLADGNEYSNIEIAHPLQLANWEMIQTISSYKSCSSIDGDWLDALIVAVDFMKTSTEGKKFKAKQIVMLSNFCLNVSDDEVDCVIKGILSEQFELVVIGPHIYPHESQDSACQVQQKSEDQEEGEKLIAKIVSETDGVICSFEDAIPQLIFYEQKKVRAAPWKVTLEIGSTIRIPIVGFKKIADVKRLKTQDVIIPQKPTAAAASNRIQTPLVKNPLMDLDDVGVRLDEDIDQSDVGGISLIEKDRIYQTSGADPAPIDFADIIQGYMFGTTVVPVTDDDTPHLTYESGPKSMSVLGFTSKVNIPLHVFKGDGILQMFPEKEENSMGAFSALVQAMDSKDVVAIVRRVYSKNSTPVIGALYPDIKPKYQSLAFIALPFSEDVVQLLFPPLVLEKNKPSKAQIEAVDQLITSMDLMKADEDESGAPTEAYKLEKVLDPSEQNFHHIVAKKALDGDSFISGAYIDENVQQLVVPKTHVLEAAKPALIKIKELFPLTEIKPKEGARKAAADLFKNDTTDSRSKQDISTQSPTSSSNPVADQKIGTVKPQEDFLNMISQGVPLDKACGLLQAVIIDIISNAFDADDLKKPYKALIFMRKKCAEEQPSIYNNWITDFKNSSPKGKDGFWELIVKDKAGLITSQESNQSTISEDDARKFLDVQVVEEQPSVPQSFFEDEDDLVNQM